MSAKTILFGGSGFFGPTVLEKYPKIVSVGRSLPPSFVKNKHIHVPDVGDLSALDDLDFDNVIFLIGSSEHSKINKHPTMGIDFNVTPLKKALYYFQRRGIEKFVCFSTILLYDSAKFTIPVNENQPLNPYVNDYIFSKFMLEETAKFYSSKVPIIVARLTNIYGPTKLVRPDLITNLIQQVLSPNKPSVENVNVMRDFLFTYDAADAIMKLLETDFTGTINLATGIGTTVADVVKIIEKLSGKEIEVLNKSATGHMKYISDITKLKSLTGWQPKYSVEEGIKMTYERMSEWAEECRWWEAASKE